MLMDSIPVMFLRFEVFSSLESRAYMAPHPFLMAGKGPECITVSPDIDGQWQVAVPGGIDAPSIHQDEIGGENEAMLIACASVIEQAAYLATRPDADDHEHALRWLRAIDLRLREAELPQREGVAQ